MEGTLKMKSALLRRKEKLKDAFNNDNVTRQYRYSESTVEADGCCASRR